MNKEAGGVSTSDGKPRKRLPAHERERHILEAATRYFAEHGFALQTRQLADEIGVSQALIFRYFGTKDQLIERVYQNVFLARWNQDWVPSLEDASVPLEERLRNFARSYLAVADDRAWIRLAMHANLEGRDLRQRYFRRFVALLMDTLVKQVRRHLDIQEAGPPTLAELEHVWHLHTSLVHYLVRKHIHGDDVLRDHEQLVEIVVGSFMGGINAGYRAAIRNERQPASGKSGDMRARR